MQVYANTALINFPFFRSNNTDVTEEIATLFRLKSTIISFLIANDLQSTLKRFDPKLDNISGVITDRTPVTTVQNESLAMLIKKETGTINNSTLLMHYYCINHQENVFEKSVSFLSVMNGVIKIVNFTRSRVLNHRELRYF